MDHNSAKMGPAFAGLSPLRWRFTVSPAQQAGHRDDHVPSLGNTRPPTAPALGEDTSFRHSAVGFLSTHGPTPWAGVQAAPRVYCQVSLPPPPPPGASPAAQGASRCFPEIPGPRGMLTGLGLFLVSSFIYLFTIIIFKNILFIHERHTEREAETQAEGEAGSTTGA